MMRKHICLFIITLISFSVHAQDSTGQDLLQSIDSTIIPQKQYAGYAFKSPRVIMSHSIEMLQPGVLDFRILHRFGNISSGINELFGLDNASFRMSFDYGITQNFTAGFGRSTYKKELDGFLKYRVARQGVNGGMPVSIVIVTGTTVQAGQWANPSRKNLSSSRYSYYAQLLAGRKFSDRFSFQLSPVMLHQNLVPTAADDNDLFVLGSGARFKMTNRMALTADYFYLFNPGAGMRNPLSIGIDIETGGHIFQLHFTNAAGMSERAFLAETFNDWGAGDISFGFNLSRTFQVRKRR